MSKYIKKIAFIALSIMYLSISSTAQAAYVKPFDLQVSDTTPRPGDSVDITLDTGKSSNFVGKKVWFVLGSRPKADGILSNPSVLGTGIVGEDGKVTFVQPVPEGMPLGKQFYVQAFVSNTEAKSALQKNKRGKNPAKETREKQGFSSPTVMGNAEEPTGKIYLSSSDEIVPSIIVGTMITPKLDNPDFIVTPNSYIDVAKNQEFTTSYPIRDAYNKAAIMAKNGGALVLLKDGLYKQMVLKNTCHDPALKLENMIWVVAENNYKAEIDRKDYGGSYSATVEKICNTTVIGLKIHSSHYQGIRLGMKGGTVIKNISFLKTEIDGGWDFYTQSGHKGYWLVSGHNMANILFRDFYFHDQWKEHAFYIHNASGDITIENGLTERVGRTAYQQVARASEGGEQSGLTTLRNYTAIDTGLENNEGGNAFTFAGGHTEGNILLDNVNYKVGFDEALNSVIAATTKYNKVGTGGLSVWSEYGKNKMNVPVLLQNSTFEYAEGAGNRQNLSVEATENFTIKNIKANAAPTVLVPSIYYPSLYLNKAHEMDHDDFNLDTSLDNNDISGPTQFSDIKYETYTELLEALE